MQKQIGFAGLGIMGSRMARKLLDNGFGVRVWNRTPGRAEPLLKAGATLGPSPRALAESCEVVVACVADPDALERVVFAEDGVLAGARAGFRFVDASTVSPETSRHVAEAFRARGADALEAPMTGSKLGAEKGALVFMTGGRPETHEELLPVLMGMGAKAIYCGETGQASVVKLIGNSIISFMLEGLCEGIVVGRKAGLPLEKIVEVVMASGYASPYFAFKGDAIAKRDFSTHFSIDLLVKDQTLMLAEAARRKASMPGLAAIREVFQSARGQGHGAEDIAAVVKALEKASGV
jgi:3-hydroxyisobutyrate dehydrogenase-like beta-hydroxyacid dehydrogenase